MQPTDKATLCTRSVLSHVSVRPPTKTYKLGFFQANQFPIHCAATEANLTRGAAESLSLPQPQSKRLPKHHRRRDVLWGSGSPVCLYNTPWGNTENCVRCDVERHQVGMTKLYTAISARTWPGRGKSGPERLFFFFFLRKSEVIISWKHMQVHQEDQAVFSAFIFKYLEFLLPWAI